MLQLDRRWQGGDFGSFLRLLYATAEALNTGRLSDHYQTLWASDVASHEISEPGRSLVVSERWKLDRPL